MTSVTDSTAAIDLDHAPKLPRRNVLSLVMVLVVQCLNSFNDNFVKMLLVAFAIAVAKGTELGDNMQVYLGAIFAVPYILFAPIAGFLSDRFSKQRVILWMQILQTFIFAWFAWSLRMHEAQLTLVLSLVGFLILATQAAFFSPAKMGIMKELSGSRRLGAVSGWLQMTMFIGILGGMWAGGTLFGRHLKATGDPWSSAYMLVIIITCVSVSQIIGSFFIHKTPGHEEVKFKSEVWWEHFVHLKLLFGDRPIRLAALGISYFWFLSNAVGTILVNLSKDTYPTSAADASETLSLMAASLGIGIMLGSVIAATVCRKRIELGLVPLAGIGMALAVLWAGLTPLGSQWIFGAMIGIGLAGGCYMTPLYAFVQDRAAPDQRARILSSINLMDSIVGFLANHAYVKVLVLFHVPSQMQLLILVLPGLLVAAFITKLLPRSLLFTILNTFVRLFYNLKAHHSERQVKTGAVLLLPNHTSYVDPLMIGSVCERDVRFVMFDELYEIKAIQWGLKVFGTVPISRTKAKEGVRMVADALKQEQAIVLYPEGQLTRTGFLNEVQRGYELMARMGGNAMVQPVWIDGLWGSIFSFERGRFFKKSPKTIPYPVNLWFGEPLPAREATAEKVHEVLCQLSAEAFAHRESVKNTPKLKLANGHLLSTDEARMAYINALRVMNTSLLSGGDILLCLLPEEHAVAKTFAVALPELLKIQVVWKDADALKEDGQRLIILGDAAAISASSLSYDLAIQVLSEMPATGTASEASDKLLPTYFDAVTGALLTLSVPDPVMPVGEEGLQLGHKQGSIGHLLGGLSFRREEGTLIITDILPGKEIAVRLANAKIDAEGFIFGAV